MPGRRVTAGTAFLFDLDGTLVDSVYQHVLAWQDALNRTGIELSVWRIHRKIGMSGGLFATALLRETGREVTAEDAVRLRELHATAYARRSGEVRPLPGARELLSYLTDRRIPWAIATSGYTESAGPTIALLDVPDGVPIVTRDQVAHAKPDPDLFLAAAQRLDVAIEESVVVGDSVWDLLAARRGRCRRSTSRAGRAARPLRRGTPRSAWPRRTRGARARRGIPSVRRSSRPAPPPR
jgi:HAD superfamily hydrolase (TIGR01509 family)